MKLQALPRNSPIRRKFQGIHSTIQASAHLFLFQKVIFTDSSVKTKLNMEPNIQAEKHKHAETIIRNHILWSMGAGLFIPVPIADVLAVSALQLDMIRQLCRVYQVDFAETQGKAVVTSLTSSTLAKVGARSLIKFIPGIGQIVGGVASSIFNGASTYALGEVFKKHFESGGTILDFDTERLKKLYQEKFEKGKKVAEQLKKEEEIKKATQTPQATTAQQAAAPSAPNPPTGTASSVVERLKELAQLRDQGIITDVEFEQMKKKAIELY